MRKEMPRSSEPRWYEPPRQRDWKTNPSDLQRIESAAASLRRTLINQATKANEGAHQRQKNVRIDPGRHVMNRAITQKDRSRSMASLPTTPRNLRSSILVGSAKTSTESYHVVRPGYLRQQSPIMRNSAMDLSATYVFRNKIRTQDEVEKILVNTPPSRTRSPSMTRYEPLPAIKHSASSMRERPTDTNCNDFSPPPLLRSRTFDVFETKMTNLPVVEDIELEGAEGSEHSGCEDDESYSGEEQDSFEDNEMSPDTADSGVVSASSRGASRGRFRYFSGKDNRYDDLFDSTPKSANVHMPVLIVTVNIEGKLLSEYLSQFMVGVRKSRPQTNRDITSVEEESSCSSEGSDEDDDGGSSPTSSDEGGSRTYSFESDEETEEEREGSQASLKDEEAEDNPASVNDEEGKDQTPFEEDEGSPASPKDSEKLVTKLSEVFEDDDVIVYVKMPDDSLMLVSNPKERTLKQLLMIVKETNVNGYRLVISRRGLEGSDLSKTLEELRLDDNTTLHLIAE